MPVVSPPCTALDMSDSAPWSMPDADEVAPVAAELLPPEMCDTAALAASVAEDLNPSSIVCACDLKASRTSDALGSVPDDSPGASSVA